ncbi:MAG: hypothetical protein KL863_21445 [Rhizobium sp.]|nr:hypothetical protein [Rhizobium sp.]
MPLPLSSQQDQGDVAPGRDSDRRLTDHLMANAVRLERASGAIDRRPGIVMSMLALVAVIGLMFVAWLYGMAFDRASRDSA